MTDDKGRQFRNELINCPKPVEIPLTLQYLEINAQTKRGLDVAMSDMEKGKINALALQLRKLVERKMQTFSGKTEAELNAMDPNSEEYKKIINETSEKLVQDGEFASFWEQIPHQFSLWHKGSLDTMGSVWIFGVLAAAGGLWKGGGLLVNGAFGAGRKEGGEEAWKGIKKAGIVAFGAAVLSSTPVLRFVTGGVGKTLELTNELAHLVVHPFDEGKSILNKMEFDKGTEAMLGTWEDRLPYIAEKDENGEDSQFKEFKWVLQKASLARSGSSIPNEVLEPQGDPFNREIDPKYAMHILAQTEVQKAKKEKESELFSDHDMDIVVEHLWKSRDVFEGEEWRDFKDRLQRKVQDKETLQRFVFADTAASLGLWLETNPTYKEKFRAAQDRFAVKLNGNPGKMEEVYSSADVQKFFRGAKQGIPENVRLTEKKGIERFLKNGFVGNYLYLVVFGTVVANLVSLGAKGIQKVKEKWEGRKRSPKENKDLLAVNRKTEKIFRNFIQRKFVDAANPTSEDVKSRNEFVETLEKQEIITDSRLVTVLKEMNPVVLAFFLRGNDSKFEASLGGPRNKIREALMNDLGRPMVAGLEKYNKELPIREKKELYEKIIPESIKYHRIKGQADDFFRILHNSKEGTKLSYDFKLDKVGQLDKNKEAQSITILELEKERGENNFFGTVEGSHEKKHFRLLLEDYKYFLHEELKAGDHSIFKSGITKVELESITKSKTKVKSD